MERVGFVMRLKPGREAEYRRRHATVWPKMIQALRGAGATNYSIFLHGADLFGYLEVHDFHRFQESLAESDVNALWQSEMTDLIDPLTDPRTGFHTRLDEVFHLE